MKRIYRGVCLCIALTAMSASAQTSPLTPQTQIANLDREDLTLSSEYAAQETTAHIVSPAIKNDGVEYTPWEDFADNWVYVSQYTGKTYTTKLRKRNIVPTDGGEVTTTQLEMTNSLFGTAYLNCNLVSGSIAISDDTGNSTIRLIDESGDTTDKAIRTTYTPTNLATGCTMQYLSSEYLALAVNYYDVNGEDHTLSLTYGATYDYLYNPDGPQAKISTDIPLYCQDNLTVSGSCGKDVTDLYYVVVNNPRNTELAAETENGESYGFIINYSNCAGLLSDYLNTGHINSSVSIGKITLDAANNFNFTIPQTWNGMRGVSLLALKNGNVTDQRYEMVEMRPQTGWKPYKQATLNFKFNYSDLIDAANLNIYKTVDLEINEASKLLRVVNPYGSTEKNLDYIYIDYSFGLDKCFVSSNYTPQTYTYTIKGKDFDNEYTATEHLTMSSFVTANYYHGFSIEHIYSWGSDFFFDITSEAPAITMFVQTKAYFLMSGQIYAQGSGSASFTLSDLIGIKILDSYKVAFSLGTDIKSVKFSLVNSDNLSITSPEYSVNESGDTYFDLIPLIGAGNIPATANALKYTAYNQSDIVVKTGILPTTLDFNVQSASISFLPSDFNLNTDGLRVCKLTQSEAGNPLVTLFNFTQGYPYGEAVDKNLLIEFINGKPTFKDYYIGILNFTNIGQCDVYMLTNQTPTIENNVISANLSWTAYQNNTAVGRWKTATATIELPKEYNLGTVGIDDILTDETDETTPIYYNLQGVRIANPAKGSVVIEVRGNKTRKTVIR